MRQRYFKAKSGKIPMPIFFPDATRAIVRTLDSRDVENTKTPGVLVNTLHLFNDYGKMIAEKRGGIAEFMSWKGAIISDSGGFQIGSLIKRKSSLGRITDEGVIFDLDGKKIKLTPETSIEFQIDLGVDMAVVLDDFDAPDATYESNKRSVERTIAWAGRAKKRYLEIMDKRKVPMDKRPYIIGVVQGGRFRDLRKYCITKLLEIGFDGFGYGGEEKIDHIKVDYSLADFLARNTPKNYLLWGLGIGKPEDIVTMSKMGFNIFDCVLPTRDARHKRLYIYNADSIDEIDINRSDFYKYYIPDRQVFRDDFSPVSRSCDCLLCRNYSRAYLYYLFKIRDISALRLSSIHNLRFYSLLLEKIRYSKKVAL